MSAARPAEILRQLEHTGAADAELLARFVATRDALAFAELVGRHGALVLGVCRRVTGHQQDAEDAFQATFLVLARKAAALRGGVPLWSWLYGVAFRVAWRTRRSALRRRAHEVPVSVLPEPHAPAPADAVPELAPILDEELAALPARYRDAIVLCDLRGATRAGAAVVLGVPEGTLSSRLANGRKKLAARLTKRGVALSAVLLPAAVASAQAGVCVPDDLVSRTGGLGAEFAVGGAVPGPLVRLAEGGFAVRKTLVSGMLVALAVAGAVFAARPRDEAPPVNPSETSVVTEKSVAVPEPKAAPGTVTALPPDPTVQDLSAVLGVTWWKFDLPKGARAVELGILEEGRFTLIERDDLQPGVDVPGPLKIAYQDESGSPGFKLTVITKGGTLRAKGDKPAEFMRTHATAVKNGEYLELGGFKQAKDKGWKYALVIKVVEKSE